MDEDQQQFMYDIGRLKKKRAQTTCYNCSKTYNNRYVPKYCSCDYLLGGKYNKSEDELDAWMLTEDLASTRYDFFKIFKNFLKFCTIVNIFKHSSSLRSHPGKFAYTP